MPQPQSIEGRVGSLAALAGAILDPRPAPTPASEARTELALPIPTPLRMPELLAAIDAFERGADAQSIERAAGRPELYAALRARHPKARVRGPSDYALIVVTNSRNERLLPLFSSLEALAQHASGPDVIAAPLAATRAIELALGMEFDGVEIDRGGAQSYRLTRVQMQRLHQALYQTLV